MKSTWRFVLKIVGLSLAVAGNLRSRHGKYPEFSDYDDDLFFED